MDETFRVDRPDFNSTFIEQDPQLLHHLERTEQSVRIDQEELILLNRRNEQDREHLNQVYRILEDTSELSSNEIMKLEGAAQFLREHLIRNEHRIDELNEQINEITYWVDSE